MKKWKIVVLSTLVVGILAFAAYIAHIMKEIEDDYIVPGDPVDYHTKEELTDLYWQNKDLLNTVKNDVLSSKKFLEALNDYGEGDYGISYKGDKIYFTEDEWSDIVTVFEKLHPYMIMMERKGRPMKFYINFDDLKLDKGSKATSLYWFPSEDELKYHKDHSLADSVEYTHIDEGWYIVEEMYPWS